MAFDYQKDIDSTFFKNIPAISKDIDPINAIQAVDSIHVYNITFIEKYVENHHVLDLSVADSLRIPPVRYTSYIGKETQKVFLVEIVPRNKIRYRPFVYFSANYNDTGACIGFGPAYFGYLKRRTWKGLPPVHVINFDAKLKVGKGCDLEKSEKTNMTFVLKDSLQLHQPVIIQKVALRSNNKIGGNRALVFDVNETFKDTSALSFRYQHSRSLKHK